MSNETTLDDVLALVGKWRSEADPKAARLLHPDACEALNGAADELEALLPAIKAALEDARRLDYIERTYSGMTNRERYLPVQMIWGKGCNGRTLREACDKYMKRDAAIDAAQEVG